MLLDCGSNLKAVIMSDYESVPTVESNAFGGSTARDSLYSIVVPDELYDEWIAAPGWSDSTISGHIVYASEYFMPRIDCIDNAIGNFVQCKCMSGLDEMQASAWQLSSGSQYATVDSTGMVLK